MGKKMMRYSLAGMAVLAVILLATGLIIQWRNKGRIAPGITVCGRDVSGMTVEEVRDVLTEILPEFLTEIRCGILPEHNVVVQADTENEVNLSVQGMELVLRTSLPPVRILEEETLCAVLTESNKAKVWEWLYKALTGSCFCIRQAEPVVVWEDKMFGEWLAVLAKAVEQDCVDAEVSLKKGKLKVRPGKNGVLLNREKAWVDAEQLMAEVAERLKAGPIEEMVLRLLVEGKTTIPKLSTGQAKACNTIIGEFTTGFAGAGEGRRQNIKAGAKHLHGRVILPGEEFSVAAALMPFTEVNGYAAGGTYIGGQLAESMGGGVCQLSTTLYNALLQTKLEITERYPHSLPVGYVPLGQDAAIAGDYKDLKFKNTTESPVVVSCEIEGETVHILIYGTEAVKREAVSFETVLTEETEENVTVEVYRTEVGEDGEPVRERVSVDRYRVKE
ncbi:MAG: VanW family protein [Lachnospiraceae bacterium]|nr:VanW family protein [Lachnospiraceae bacterium]